MQPKVRRDGVLAYQFGTELLIYDTERNHGHSLNEVTSLIWRHCDGQTSVSELVKIVGRETKLPANEAIVWLALDRLEQAELLQEPLQRPEAATALTRRQVARQFGLTGALALLLPVVTSMKVSADPLPNAGSTGGPKGVVQCGARFHITTEGAFLLVGGCDTLATPSVRAAAQATACALAQGKAQGRASLQCPESCPPVLISGGCDPGTCSDDIFTVSADFEYECVQPPPGP